MKIFISYSHRDKKYLDDLLLHLTPLTRGEGSIETWSDKMLRVGDNWKESIKASIDECDVAILLISAPFLASDFIINEELEPLYNRHSLDGIKIICVPVSHSSFESDKILSQFQSLPSPDKPIKSLSSAKRDRIYEQIRQSVAQTAGLDVSLGKVETKGPDNIKSESLFSLSESESWRKILELTLNVDKRKIYKNESINIASFWQNRSEYADDYGFLSDYKFENCHIFGPAVIYLVNCGFSDPKFEDEIIGVESHLFTQFKKSKYQYIFGVLLFEDSNFTNCSFEDVAFFAFDGNEAQSYLKLLRKKTK